MLTQKNYTLEKKCDEIEAQKDFLKLAKIEFEVKFQRKKDKFKAVKREKEDILKKLEGYIDKDSENKELMMKKNWQFEKDQMISEEKHKDYMEANEKLRYENNELKLEIKNLQEEIENLKSSAQGLKNQLNDEFMKNMKNLKVIQGLKKERMLQKSKTFEKDSPVFNENNSLQSLNNENLSDKQKTEENLINEKKFSIESFESPEIRNYPKSDKSDELSPLYEENAERSLEKKEANEKKIMKMGKSKKSVFSQQMSIKTFKNFAKKEENAKFQNFAKKEENVTFGKENTAKDASKPKFEVKRLLLKNKNEESSKNLKEKNDEILKTPLNNEIKGLKKKMGVSFHWEKEPKTEGIKESKDFLEKYVENLSLETISEKMKLLCIIKKISKLDQNSKIFDNLLKVMEMKDIDIEELLKTRKMNEKIKEIKLTSKDKKSEIFHSNALEEKTSNSKEKSNEKNSSKQQLKNLMNIRQEPNEEHKIDDIDSHFFKEYLKFKEENNLEVLKVLIMERISIENEKIHENQAPFTKYNENERKVVLQKAKAKSIPSIKALNFLNPFENNKATQRMNPTLTFSKENMVLYRKLRTENGPRTTKSINNGGIFQAVGLKEDKNDRFGRRASNHDVFHEKKEDKDEEFLFGKLEKNVGFYENLKKNEESNHNEENFSKNKGFFKYPFKSINNKYETVQTTNDKELEYSFDAFEKIYRNLLAKHEKCGPYCDHLKRFYTRVRFVNKYFHKEELSLHKNLIDKLNFPEDV